MNTKPLSKQERAHILRRVANHVSRWPHLYNFWRTGIPLRGECGCLLGRAGRLMNAMPNTSLDSVAKRLGYRGQNGHDAECMFYWAMSRVSRHDWRDNAQSAAQGLRKLANHISPRT